MMTTIYSNEATPEGYVCGTCGASGVKLWRAYQICGSSLFCRGCALKREGEPDSWNTDQIGWLVPAVPIEGGRGFWGYSSVPIAGCRWWHRLAPHSSAKQDAKYLLPDAEWIEHLRRQHAAIAAQVDPWPYLERLFLDDLKSEAARLGLPVGGEQ